MAIRAVLFDWGGTLVRDDTVRLLEPCDAVAAYARETLGLAVESRALEQAFQAVLPPYLPGETLVSPHIVYLMGSAFARLGLPLEEQEAEACGLRFFDADAAGQRLYDDARALLASLRMRGYAVGVVTNTIFPGSFLWSNLMRLGIAGYVDALVTSVDAGYAKPHPAPYEKVLADLRLEPADAIFVGDRLDTDIAGARAAGIVPLFLARNGWQGEADGFEVIERLSGVNLLLGEGSAK